MKLEIGMKLEVGTKWEVGNWNEKLENGRWKLEAGTQLDNETLLEVGPM